MQLQIITLCLSIFLSCGANQKAQDDVQDKQTYRVEKYTQSNKLGKYGKAVFAGGCFWCTEAVFERIEGVVDVISGYAGGHKEYPGYYEVGDGSTGHAEAIYIYYDESKVDYKTLLKVFFVAHDPTTLNRQGPDVGEEYRSVVFYTSEAEKEIIERQIAEVNSSDRYGDPVVTQVVPYEEFWVAEDYHQNYYELHPENSYVTRVSKPKVEKVIKTYPELLKSKYRK